jgi:hypothetical protein
MTKRNDLQKIIMSKLGVGLLCESITYNMNETTFEPINR